MILTFTYPLVIIPILVALWAILFVVLGPRLCPKRVWLSMNAESDEVVCEDGTVRKRYTV